MREAICRSVSAAVAHLHHRARVVAQRNGAALGRADAHGVNPDAVLRGDLRLVDHVAFEVLAVGDEDEDLQVIRLAFEGVDGGVDGGGDVGAGARDGVGVELAQGVLERVMVDGQRALEEGVAGKGDQPEAIVRQLIGEVGQGELGPLEAVRLHVLGQHALGAIDRD